MENNLQKISKNIHDDWGSVFTGPHDWLANASPESLSQFLYTRKLLVFKKIKLTPHSFWGLCNRFGLPWAKDQYTYSKEKAVPITMKDGSIHFISEISNKISKRLGDREMPWHADIPNAVSYAFPIRAIWMKTCPNPEAGFTIWMNTPKAYSTVSDDLKARWSGTKIVQQSWYEPGKDLQEFESMMLHPITGELCPRVNYHVDDKQNEGWIVDTKVNDISKGTDIVAEMLAEMEKQTNCIYEPHWDETDLIIYDNYQFVHRRTALDIDDGMERLMLRMNIDHDLTSNLKLFDAV